MYTTIVKRNRYYLPTFPGRPVVPSEQFQIQGRGSDY